MPIESSGSIPVALSRLKNGKIAYTVNGNPFYPRALETGWWDTRIPDIKTNNEYLRTDTDWDYVFMDMKSIGANTAQLMIYWSDWEPKQGVYDYTFLDKVIKKAASYGLKTELIIFMHSHAISGVIPRSQDDFWAYYLEDSDGKCYPIQWGKGNLNSTAAFWASAAPGNGQEIFLEYWHPQIFPKVIDAFTNLAEHYKNSDNVIGYQLGNEEEFDYYVNGGNDQNPYYSRLKNLYMKEHSNATEKDFRIATINNLWISFNNAIHAADPYKPTTSNLQSGLTERFYPKYNPNDGTTISFYKNLDMIGSMFYGDSQRIYPNLDAQYNGNTVTKQNYATMLPILFPTEIGANVKDSRVLKIIAAETMERGGQGFGVYCYGELYTNSRDYKNSPPKASRTYTHNLFTAVNAFQNSIWAGVPVTAKNTSNIFMEAKDKSYNPTLAVLETNADSALGLLYFKGALGNNVNEEDRSRNVTVSVKEPGTYKVEVRVTNGTEPTVHKFKTTSANGKFEVPVKTTNANVAFIEVTKIDHNNKTKLISSGKYKIQYVKTGKYLATQSDTVSGKYDEFVVTVSDNSDAFVWNIAMSKTGEYFVLNDEKGMNVRFRGKGSNYIVVSPKNDNSNQHWKITRVGNGIYNLINQNTRQYLDSLDKTYNTVKVEQRPKNNGLSQQWRFIPIE